MPAATIALANRACVLHVRSEQRVDECRLAGTRRSEQHERLPARGVVPQRVPSRRIRGIRGARYARRARCDERSTARRLVRQKAPSRPRQARCRRRRAPSQAAAARDSPRPSRTITVSRWTVVTRTRRELSSIATSLSTARRASTDAMLEALRQPANRYPFRAGVDRQVNSTVFIGHLLCVAPEQGDCRMASARIVPSRCATHNRAGAKANHCAQRIARCALSVRPSGCATRASSSAGLSRRASSSSASARTARGADSLPAR